MSAGRESHTSLLLHDGSVLIMGGRNSPYDSGYLGDVWRSTDQGTSWVVMTNRAGWGYGGGKFLPNRTHQSLL